MKIINLSKCSEEMFFKKDNIENKVDFQNHIRRLEKVTFRIAIYGIPTIFCLWLYVAFPLIFPKNLTSIFSFGISIFFSILIVPFAHEALHLIAIPTRIFHHDTKLLFHINGIRSLLAVKIGGDMNKYQLIWCTLMPILSLTLRPFVLLMNGVQLDISIGLIAAINFGLSAQDIIQAIAYFVKFKGHDKINLND